MKNVIRLYARVPSLVNDVSIIFLNIENKFCEVEEFNGRNELVYRKIISNDEMSQYLLNPNFKLG